MIHNTAPSIAIPAGPHLLRSFFSGENVLVKAANMSATAPPAMMLMNATPNGVSGYLLLPNRVSNIGSELFPKNSSAVSCCPRIFVTLLFLEDI